MISYRSADILDRLKTRMIIDVFTEHYDQTEAGVTVYWNNDEARTAVVNIITKQITPTGNQKWVQGRQETRLGLNNIWKYDQQNPIKPEEADLTAYRITQSLLAAGFKNSIPVGQDVAPLGERAQKTFQVGHLTK